MQVDERLHEPVARHRLIVLRVGRVILASRSTAPATTIGRASGSSSRIAARGSRRTHLQPCRAGARQRSLREPLGVPNADWVHGFKRLCLPRAYLWTTLDTIRTDFLSFARQADPTTQRACRQAASRLPLPQGVPASRPRYPPAATPPEIPFLQVAHRTTPTRWAQQEFLSRIFIEELPLANPARTFSLVSSNDRMRWASHSLSSLRMFFQTAATCSSSSTRITRSAHCSKATVRPIIAPPANGSTNSEDLVYIQFGGEPACRQALPCDAVSRR